MKRSATGGTFMPLMKIIVIIAIIFFIPTLLSAQPQVKKGRWFIGHSIGGPDYEMYSYKTYDNNAALIGHTKFSGLFFNLSFIGPNWGGISGNSYQQENVLTGEELDNKSMSVTLQPTAGFFVRDNLVIGASVLLSASSSRSGYSENEATNRASSFGAGIGPLLRYYIGNRTKSKPFVGLESRFTMYSFKQKSSSTQAAITYRSERDQDNTSLMVLPQLGYAWFPGKRWILELRLQYRYDHMKAESTERSFTNNVMNMGYPRDATTKEARHAIGVMAGVAFTLN
jgi:hypothetical protein